MPWRQVRIDLHNCLPCLPSERHVPEAGVTGRFMSQLLNHRSPQCSVLWKGHWPGVMLWSSTVNCSCVGADSSPFHLFLMKLSGTIFVSFLHLPLFVGQPEIRNEMLLQKQKRMLQYNFLSKGASFPWSNCPCVCQSGCWVMTQNGPDGWASKKFSVH